MSDPALVLRRANYRALQAPGLKRITMRSTATAIRARLYWILLLGL